MSQRPRLLYIANIRLPNEKAHSSQIMQMCEAFAAQGWEVSLWVPRRYNLPAFQGLEDVWAHYAVAATFSIERLPTLDLLPLGLRWQAMRRLERLFFYLQTFSFTVALLLRAWRINADCYYSRDPLPLLALSFLKPRHLLSYEAHALPASRLGRAVLGLLSRRVGQLVTVTGHLRERFLALGAREAQVLVAHDGIRAARYADLPERQAARQQVGWPADLFIVGYMGRLHTMGMDKGVGLLVEALRQLPGAALALVGGPDEQAEQLRQQWLAAGLPASHFLYAGQVAAGDVPLYLRAFDVGAMPFPWTEHFAYYASPMKLFEYMMAGIAILATALPSTEEVVRDGESALMVAPGDVEALAAALQRLQQDAALRAALGQQAAALAATHYTWAARAGQILQHLQAQAPL